MYAFGIMNPTVTFNYNAPREMHKRRKKKRKKKCYLVLTKNQTSCNVEMTQKEKRDISYEYPSKLKRELNK